MDCFHQLVKIPFLLKIRIVSLLSCCFKCLIVFLQITEQENRYDLQEEWILEPELRDCLS